MYDEHIPLSEDERGLLNHISRWGSDGWPIHKVGSHHWVWGPFRSLNGSPVVFKTKKAASESFVKYYDSLLARNGEDARRKAMADTPELSNHIMTKGLFDKLVGG